MRDTTLPVHALVLFGISALASDAGPVALSSAATLLVAYSVFHATTSMPSLRKGSVPLALAAMACVVPFARAIDLAGRAPLTWPIATVGVAWAAGLLALRSSAALKTTLAAVVATGFVVAILVDSLAISSIPRVLRVPTSPLARLERSGEEVSPRTAPLDDPAFEAVRPGALVRRELAVRAGLFPSSAVDAPWVNVPAGVARPMPANTVLVRVVAPAAPARVEGRFRIVAGPELPDDARDLDAVDVVLLLEAIDRRAASVRVLEAFVRRGGLLAGPAAPGSFGADLDRALGTALPSENGPRGVKALGAGHVARVARAEGLDELAAAGLVEPRFATVFDRATASPPTPLASARTAASPPRLSWPFLGVLGAFTFAVIVASRADRWRSALAVGVLSAIATGALSLLAVSSPAATAEAFTLDMGGRLGRRLDVLRVTAGADGASMAIRSTDGVRLLGFRARRTPPGVVTPYLAPGEIGWIVEDGFATGAAAGIESVSSVPAWSLPFLRPGAGRTPDARMYAGEAAFAGQVPDGVLAPTRVRRLVIGAGRP